MFRPCDIPIYISNPLPVASGNLDFGTRKCGSVDLKITRHRSRLWKMEKLMDQPLISSELWAPLWSMVLIAVTSLLTSKLKELEYVPIPWPLVSKLSGNLVSCSSRSC